MRQVLRLAAAFAALVLTACATPAPPPPAVSPKAQADVVVLVSLDGFRPDYLDRGITPNLSGLAAQGALASMRPSFPSKTFPNHYTLITGRRPDRNGVVDNNMEDPAIPGVAFSMGNPAAVRDERWWDQATPLWVSAEQQGIRAATMYWPGSEAAVHGVRPSLWRPFDKTVTGEQRVDQVLAWLDLPPAERPHFVTLYFEEVDSAGHAVGPGPQIDPAVAHLDSVIGRLVVGLKARGLKADLVIVSDHGMAAISRDRVIFADDLLPNDAYRTVTMGAFWSVVPTAGREAEVERALLKPHDHMNCWRKGEMPARFAYGRNPRVPPIVCLPQTGWEVTTHAFLASHPKAAGGDHGFDPDSPDMYALFLAAGPDIKVGARPALFDNVDVYPFVAHLAGVKAEPGDGDLAPLAGALATTP